MAEKVIGSYLYELKPFIDTKKWKEASGSIDKAVSSSKISYDEWKGKKAIFKEQIEQMSKLKKEIEQLEKMAEKASGTEKNRISNLLNGYTYVDSSGNERSVKGKRSQLQDIVSETGYQKTEMDMYSGMVSGGDKFKNVLGGFAGEVSAASASVVTFYEMIKKAIKSGLELVNAQAEMVNKLNSSGAFANMATRDVMARYGVNSVTANAMTSALSQLGLSESDIGRMTKAQKDAYDELISYYKSGIDNIDPDKLEEYYDTMEEFQLKQSEWKIGIQNQILKMVAESDSFKKLTGSLETFFEKSLEFLESDAVQWFLNTFIEFLSSIVDFGSDVLGLFGGSSGSSTTNNSSNNSKNNYYIYGSDYSSNSDLARSIALQQNNGGTL